MQEVISYTQLTKQFQGISTYLFDMDGTVMNTEVIHARAINLIIKEQTGTEIALDKLEIMCIGLTDEVVYHKLVKDQLVKSMPLDEFLDHKKQLFNEILKEIDPSVIFKPRVKKLLRSLSKEHNLALVTSSERETTHVLLDFLGIKDLFHHIITREDTKDNKPHPAPYHLAMEKFSVSAKECLIFEDSVPGRTAAINSGATLFEVDWYLPNL